MSLSISLVNIVRHLHVGLKYNSETNWQVRSGFMHTYRIPRFYSYKITAERACAIVHVRSTCNSTFLCRLETV